MRNVPCSHHRICILAVGCVLAAGCRQEVADLPDTFPVTGSVLLPDGAPLEKGLIQFEAEYNRSLNVSAGIDAGRFSLSTAFGNGVAAGALPGRYRVVVTPAFKATPKPVSLPNLFEVRAPATELVIQLPANR